MRRVEADHHKERLFRVPYVPLIPQIGGGFDCFKFGRPLVYLMLDAFGIPIVRMLVDVIGPVRIPVIETMPAFCRRIGIPGRNTVFHVFSGTFRVIGSRAVDMQFPDISTVISGLAEHVANAGRIFAQ